MAIDSKQRRKLLSFIQMLEVYRGRHTELVSVYIPAGYDLNKVIGHLAQEQGTASNIKDSTTRKNVIDSLERMIQHLRLYKQTPEHGLAAFAGNVAEREGQQDIQVWSLETPEPLNFRLYRCDKTFILDSLREMADRKDMYGLVVMDKRDGQTALLKGKTIITLSKTSSNVPGKTRAGGQSSQRFMRIRENAAKEFMEKVGEYMKNDFLPIINDIKGIIVGGPGQTKYEFVNGNHITDQVKKKIIAIKDLSYTEEFGLQELLEKSDDVLANEEVSKEKKLMQRFFDTLAKTPLKISYGEEHVRKSLEMGVVDTLLLSEALDDKVIDELEQKAEQFGTTVEIISTETREGAQLRDLGKFGAILRYEIE